jgi:hypothetical protein
MTSPTPHAQTQKANTPMTNQLRRLGVTMHSSAGVSVIVTREAVGFLFATGFFPNAPTLLHSLSGEKQFALKSRF